MHKGLVSPAYKRWLQRMYLIAGLLYIFPVNRPEIMRLILPILLLITAHSFAQPPSSGIRRDSVPSVFPPDVIPNVRPNNAFYQDPRDPKNVIRATLDNMPVKVPDSSTHYTIMHTDRQQRQLWDRPLLIPKPALPIGPKTN